MKSNFSMVEKILNATKKSFKEQRIDNRNAFLKYASGEVNVSLEEAQHTNMLIDQMQNSIERVIDTISVEEFGGIDHKSIFTQAQIQAAKMIAPYAMAPAQYADKLRNLNKPDNGNGAIEVTVESMGLSDIVDFDTLSANISTEAYDGQYLNKAVYFSIAYNLGAARQDEFGEAFFPTIAIDPVQSGVTVDVQFAVLYKEYQRQITGKIDHSQYARTPIIKAIYDPEVFGTNNLKVIPVYRENQNKSLFLFDEKYVDKSTGVAIQTAPLKFGEKVELLGISQTDETLAKGMMDNTDALDRTIGLEKVYYSLTKSSSSEMFYFDATIYSYRHFTYGVNNHHKGMTLNFNTSAIIINLSEVKKSDGKSSEILQTLATSYPNYKVVLNVTITGSTNTMTSITELFGNKLSIVQILDGAGKEVPQTDSAYTAIALIFNTAKLEGYTLEAYRTNSNIRTRGLPVGVDRYAHVYTVPMRSGMTATGPVQNVQGTDNDAALLGAQIQFAGLFISMSAVQTLTNFANAMHQASANGSLGSFESQGIGQYLANPWFRDTTFDLSSIIDSTQSHHRDDDIREALRLKIRQEVLEMFTYSNYGAAYDVLRGNLGGKIGVIIGTDPTLKTLLLKDSPVFDLGEKFEARVVSTLNSLVTGKIFITFGVFGEDRNSSPMPLNFGNCFWAPTISYEVVRSGAAINRELHNNPRFLHVIHLPILSVFTVTDVKGAFTKIPINVNAKTIS